MNNHRPFHSGMITLIGQPNAGKSTLLNTFLGEKIAIVSDKPQTTRSRLMGIVTKDDCQMIFLDTPGIHVPKNKLGEYMMKSVRDSLDGTDIILMLADATANPSKDLETAKKISSLKAVKILAVNKIDLIQPQQLLSLIARFAEFSFDDIIPVSAKTGEGTDTLLSCLKNKLPEGPHYFPEDMITDQPERILCAEIIREKALRHLRDEVPHGIGVEIVKMDSDRESFSEINATIYCEKESHKGMIIGRQGTMLRKIGEDARADIELLLGKHVMLKLWVKVKPDWRNNRAELKNLGYES